MPMTTVTVSYSNGTPPLVKKFRDEVKATRFVMEQIGMQVTSGATLRTFFAGQAELAYYDRAPTVYVNIYRSWPPRR